MSRILYGLFAAGLTVLSAYSAGAQLAPPRTLDELKVETQARADRNAYPITGLKPDNVREALSNIHSLDRDEWAAAWSAIAARYDAKAKSEEANHQPTDAQADYRQAWRLYSFARWPVTNSPGKLKAYQQALAAFRNYARFMDPPLEIVRIPFEGKAIVGYLRLPKGVQAAPVVMTISALDSRKEDNAEHSDAYIRRGIAVFSLDMPGTGEAPIKVDLGAERMFSAALDYLQARPELDKTRMAVESGSWGGYWSAKLAFIEKDRLKGVVSQSGPVDGYFSPEWQRTALGTREYLFDLFPARASVYGVSTLDDFLAYGPRMSLKTEGYLGKPTAPMLLIGGNNDTQVPVGDTDLLLHSGTPKDAWINPGGGHMGRSADWPDGKIFEQIVVPWIARQLGTGAS
jgi:pimeloyl-ACP methyl ester carboxylesterase